MIQTRPQDWILKSLAGVVFGLALAVAASGIFHHLAPIGLSKFQLEMWLVVPLWMGIFSLSYLFTTGLRACLWLGAATALGFGFLFVIADGVNLP